MFSVALCYFITSLPCWHPDVLPLPDENIDLGSLRDFRGLIIFFHLTRRHETMSLLGGAGADVKVSNAYTQNLSARGGNPLREGSQTSLERIANESRLVWKEVLRGLLGSWAARRRLISLHADKKRDTSKNVLSFLKNDSTFSER